MTITYRKADIADSYNVFKVFLRSIMDYSERMNVQAITGGNDPEKLASIWEKRKPLFDFLARDASQFWVAEKDGEILGYARTIEHDGLQELTGFFVSPNRQSAGEVHLYIAQPPLYRIAHENNVKYVYSDKEKDKIIKESGENKASLQRYKGLGEMNPDQLWDTTMNPSNRTLLFVTIDDAAEADRTFDMLMGDAVNPHKKFIQTHAKSVRNLDI